MPPGNVDCTNPRDINRWCKRAYLLLFFDFKGTENQDDLKKTENQNC